MYITQLDELFDKTIDNFYKFLLEKKAFNSFKRDLNFVSIQNYIIDLIKDFTTKNINKKDILQIIKNERNYNIAFEILKRYCAYYVYLSIAFLYEGERDLYATNIIESSKNQKDGTYQIENFFNSENNSNLISFFNDIKNLLAVIKLGKTMDQIKIILKNNPINFESTLKFVNNLGDDYIIQYILIKENMHNIIKTIIFRLIYLNEEKKDIVRILKQEEEDKGEYKYIEVIYSKESKLVDFTLIQKFLTVKQIRQGLAEEIYSYLEENKEEKELSFKENIDYVQYLITNNIIIPVTEDFLRYHKDSEKYDSDTSLMNEMDIKERDATKIKYIINKMNKIRNIKSEMFEKNPKLKLDAEKLYYKPLDYKEAILYNDNEEIKIIQKLEDSEKTADLDLLIDLENIRKYAYVNYKDHDGMKIRPIKPTICIRNTNIKHDSRDKTLETRIGNDSLDINVVGVIWNPSRLPIDCFKKENILKVTDIMKNDNGYLSFKKIIEKTFTSQNRNLYFWEFNHDKDIPNLDDYVNFNTIDKEKNIFTLLAEIYKTYSNSVEKKLLNYINSFEELNHYQLDNIIRKYNKQLLDFEFDTIVKKNVINFSLVNKLISKEIIPDEVESKIPGMSGDIIKLPEIDVEKYKKNIIIVTSDKEEEEIDLENEKLNAICEHYVKWGDIKKFRRQSDIYSQKMFDFIKQYVRLNDNNDYTCKSCGEYLNIPNDIVTGTFVKEKDEFLTTSIVVNEDLEKIPKYSKFMKVIRNLQKNIEKISFSSNLSFYLGSQETKKVRRKMIIKDTIDLLLIHSQYLKSQPKDRISKYSTKYGIIESYTRLFFFELKDDIFVTRSDDTDQFKPIKINNIMSYLTLMMIADLNPGQILGLKYDKIGNFYRFNLLKEQIFGKLFIRTSQKEKIRALSRPLFCYTVYYFSAILVNNFYWQSENLNTEKKNKGFDFNTHIIIIHTLFDLLNSIAEANIDYENQNFFYQILSMRILDKLKNVYNDNDLLERIKEESSKDFKIEGKTVKRIVKNVPFIETNITEYDSDFETDSCTSSTTRIKTKSNSDYDSELNAKTNCPDGKFHEWKISNGDLVCSLCNQNYSKLNKKTTSSVEDYQSVIDQLKNENIKKLLKDYCLDAQFHEFTSDSPTVCTKCKINPSTYKYTDKDIRNFEKALESNNDTRILEDLNKSKNLIESIEKEKIKSNKVIKKFEKRYDVNTKSKLKNYVDDFIDRLVKILGKKPKISGEDTFIKDTYYFIDHDYLGTETKSGFKIFENEDKVIHEKNNKNLEKDVYFYKDRTRNITVYYDAKSFQYLGYMENNKFYKQKSTSYLKKYSSIRDKLLKLGVSNRYIRKDLLTKSDDPNEIINKTIRYRSNNLKKIINTVISIIHSIKYGKKQNSIYSIEEKRIINEYIKTIKKFKMLNNEGRKSVFKHSKYILNKIPIHDFENVNIDFDKDYIDTEFLDSMNSLDSKLLFFLIYNFNRLLDYNSENKNNQLTLSSLIVKIIEYNYDEFYTKVEDVRIRRFIEEESIKAPFLNDSFRVIRSYEELIEQEDPADSLLNVSDSMTEDEVKDIKYDMEEAFNSLDIDEYDDEDEPYMPETDLD